MKKVKLNKNDAIHIRKVKFKERSLSQRKFISYPAVNLDDKNQHNVGRNIKLKKQQFNNCTSINSSFDRKQKGFAYMKNAKKIKAKGKVGHFSKKFCNAIRRRLSKDSASSNQNDNDKVNDMKIDQAKAKKSNRKCVVQEHRDNRRQKHGNYNSHRHLIWKGCGGKEFYCDLRFL